MFEIILRNSIDRHMTAQHGNEWLENAISPGGYLDINIGCEVSYHSVQEAIHKLGVEFTHDELITKLTFGFWTYQFAPKQFSAAGNTLLGIFPNRPFGTKQKTVFQSLIRINDLRNRIAHHEPICFRDENISIEQAANRYELIYKMLSWLGCNPLQILAGIDNVEPALQAVAGIL